jgi:hypothetical protein
MKVIQMRYFVGFWLSVVALLLYTVSVSAQTPIEVECGDVIEGEFVESNTDIIYLIDLNAGDSVTVETNRVGDYLWSTMFLSGPSGNRIESGGTNINPRIQSRALSSNGTYEILYSSIPSDALGIGLFTLSISCTLRDGTVIAAGGTAPANSVENSEEIMFSGFGFPGLPPRDFSDGIEIPLAAGQPQTVPIGGDVALYTYDATATETATLTASRVSGDISLGVTVINRDTNEIIFVGGMPSSDNLSVDLTFPSDGTYVIGLFQLDTDERSGTSGAVQVRIE